MAEEVQLKGSFITRCSWERKNGVILEVTKLVCVSNFKIIYWIKQQNTIYQHVYGHVFLFIDIHDGTEGRVRCHSGPMDTSS